MDCQPTNHETDIITITQERQLWEGDGEKLLMAYNRIQSRQLHIFILCNVGGSYPTNIFYWCRFFAICYPMKVKSICTTRRAKTVIPILWIISASFGWPYILIMVCKFLYFACIHFTRNRIVEQADYILSGHICCNSFSCDMLVGLMDTP